MKISLVSPHRDDACFSLGVSLLRWARAGHRIHILNCFTRSAYAPFSDADSIHSNDRTAYVSAIREREDEVFLRRLPQAVMTDLRLKDAPLRFRCGVDEVCDRAVETTDPALAKIAQALEKRVVPGEVDLLLLPLGIGHHVDHGVVREAGLSLASVLPCGFYEDLPYSTREGADKERASLTGDLSTRLHMELHPLLCGGGTSAGMMKRDLARIYGSQIDQTSIDAMGNWADLQRGERIWGNDRLAAMVTNGIPSWSEASSPQPA